MLKNNLEGQRIFNSMHSQIMITKDEIESAMVILDLHIYAKSVFQFDYFRWL